MRLARTYFSPLILVAAPLMLAACAGTRVKDVETNPSTIETSSPHTVAVLVENNSPAPLRASRRASQLEDAKLVVATLTDQLGKVLGGRGLIVVSPDAHPDLTLRCNILEVRGGNEWLRVLIGYGAGRAELRTKVTLFDSTVAMRPLVAFEIDSTTGKMPGAGYGLASGQALSAGGAALSIPGAMKQGLGQEVNDSTEHIDHELSQYFKSQHWPYMSGEAGSVSASGTTSLQGVVSAPR